MTPILATAAQAASDTAELPGGFGGLDWVVVLGVLLGTTVLGHRLSGKQSSTHDFFLGGRRLPWFAVAASIIATEISAVTYVSLPAVISKPGGNITYLQIGLFGSLIARVLVAWFLVPRYYEREIYSPYDWMGSKLGEGVRRATTILFSIGGVLGQASRVFLTAIILEVLLQEPLTQISDTLGFTPVFWAVAAIGLVSVLWTWMGGIATVVWTDAVLFVLFLVGIATVLITVNGGVDGGMAGAFAAASAEGKLQLLRFETDPTVAYTVWTALFFASWGQVGPYGTDQLMVQRLLCCKNVREARKAMIASYAAMVVTVLVSGVGIALWAWYDANPATGASAAFLAEDPERVLPLFVREVLPAGLRGLVIVGAIAAAISSLDSILAALSQTTLHAFWRPLRERRAERLGISLPEGEAKSELLAGRVLVLIWAFVLCGAALWIATVRDNYASILDLALASAGFTGGAILAAFGLACLPGKRGAAGFVWAAPLSVLTVLFTKWHPIKDELGNITNNSAYVASWVAFGVILGLWILFALPRRRQPHGATQTLVLAFYLFLLTRLADEGVFERVVDGVEVERAIAWPYYVPIGSTVAFFFALILDRPARRSDG